MKIKAKHTHPGYYNAAGSRVPSVTTIAKLIDRTEGLIHWAWKCGMEGIDYRQARDEAASAGHLCHAMIEGRILGREIEADPTIGQETKELAERGFKGFETWIEMNRFKLMETEVALVSERHQYGGRLDCIASVNGESCIVDWKTTSGVYPSYVVQVAGYRGAWNETHKENEIEGCHLLRVKKDDAGFVHHYFPPQTLEKAWQAFLLCRDLYDKQKEIAKAL